MNENDNTNKLLLNFFDSQDQLRDKIFATAYSFYRDNCDVDWLYENDRLIFEEFVEYYEKDRPSQLNELIEAELNWINGFTDHSGIDTIIRHIQKQDDEHLISLLKTRSYFNCYV